MARIRAYEYTRCPRLDLDADSSRIIDMQREGYLRALTPRERAQLPPKLLEALQLAALLKQDTSNG